MAHMEPVFWGPTTTAWTAFSSIGTLAAVVVALGLPFFQRRSRQLNLEAVIIRELEINRSTLERSLDPDIATGEFSSTGLNRPTLIATSLQSLNVSVWELHRESLAELSHSRFAFFDEAFERIAAAKKRGDDFEDWRIETRSLEFSLAVAQGCVAFLDRGPKGIVRRLKRVARQREQKTKATLRAQRPGTPRNR